MKKPNPKVAGRQSREHHATRKENIRLANGHPHLRLVSSKPIPMAPVPAQAISSEETSPAPKGIWDRLRDWVAKRLAWA